MSSEENIQDSQVLNTLLVLTGTLFGFFVLMVVLARSIAY